MTPDLPPGFAVCDHCHALVPETYRRTHNERHVGLLTRISDVEVLLLAVEAVAGLDSLLADERDVLAQLGEVRDSIADWQPNSDIPRAVRRHARGQRLKESAVADMTYVEHLQRLLDAERGLTRALLARMDQARRALRDQDWLAPKRSAENDPS